MYGEHFSANLQESLNSKQLSVNSKQWKDSSKLLFNTAHLKTQIW